MSGIFAKFSMSTHLLGCHMDLIAIVNVAVCSIRNADLKIDIKK